MKIYIITRIGKPYSFVVMIAISQKLWVNSPSSWEMVMSKYNVALNTWSLWDVFSIVKLP